MQLNIKECWRYVIPSSRMDVNMILAELLSIQDTSVLINHGQLLLKVEHNYQWWQKSCTCFSLSVNIFRVLLIIYRQVEILLPDV